LGYLSKLLPTILHKISAKSYRIIITFIVLYVLLIPQQLASFIILILDVSVDIDIRAYWINRSIIIQYVTIIIAIDKNV